MEVKKSVEKVPVEIPTIALSSDDEDWMKELARIFLESSEHSDTQQQIWLIDYSNFETIRRWMLSEWTTAVFLILIINMGCIHLLRFRLFFNKLIECTDVINSLSRLNLFEGLNSNQT
jgi:hypothetical protein